MLHIPYFDFAAAIGAGTKPDSFELVGPWSDAQRIQRSENLRTQAAAKVLEAKNKLLVFLSEHSPGTRMAAFSHAADLNLPNDMLHWTDAKYTYGFSDLPELLEVLDQQARERVEFRALLVCDDTRRTSLPKETRASLLYKGRHFGLTTVLLRDDPVNPRLAGHFLHSTIVHVTLLKNPRNICRELDLRFGPFKALEQIWAELAKKPESCFLVFSGQGRIQWFKL